MLILPFAAAVEAIIRYASESLLTEMCYANDLVLMCESIKNQRKVFEMKRSVREQEREG